MLMPDRKGVSLCIEDVFVEVYQVNIIRKEQEKVFECFSEEKTLHLISGLRIARILDVVYGSVAAGRDLDERFAREQHGHEDTIYGRCCETTLSLPVLDLVNPNQVSQMLFFHTKGKS